VERNIKFTSPTTTVTFYPGAPRAITLPAAAPPALPPAPPPAAPRPLTVPQVMRGPSPSVPGAMPPATPSLPPPVTAPQPQTPSHPPFATDSGEEEMPEEEEPPTPTPAPRRKGKAKAKSVLPPQPTRKSTRTSKPSYYVTRLFRGEGTTTGQEEEPAHTPSAAERQWYHPDWTGPSASSAFSAADFANSEIDYSFVAETAELIQITANELGDDPKTLTEARSRPDWPKWQEAMDREMKTLEDAGTWTDVPRPTDKNVVSSKWVFHIKRKADGTVKKYKARLVARGFTQRFGIDYFDTYSPVARLASIRTILAIAACNDWEIDTFNFNGAYLNGELNDNEQIYMEPPPRYGNQGEFVKFLLKSLYGLKQAGRKWYDTLVRTLADLGFHVSDADPGVFYAHDRDDITMLASHVDDCVITGTSKELITDYKQRLDAIFSLTDLGGIHWLLGIKIMHDRQACTISLSQTTYIETILDRFSLSDAKPYATPIVPGANYTRSQAPADPAEADYMQKIPYREAVGSLMYAAVATHPDITFAISTLSQFLDNPGCIHWEAVKRVFRYLAGTKTHTLTYGNERHNLTGFTNADGSSQEHHHAISGYAFFINGGAVSWASKKQELITLSTAEAEYVAATHAAKECIWLRRLMEPLFGPAPTPTTLYCDNQAALHLAAEDNYHAHTKHINIRYHFIRRTIADKQITMVYCPTEEMTADILTKALPKYKTAIHLQNLGIVQA